MSLPKSPDRLHESPSRGGRPDVAFPHMSRPPWSLGTLLLAGLMASAGCTLGGPPSLEPSASYPHPKEIHRKSPLLTGLVISTEKFVDLNLGDTEEGTQIRPTGYTVYDEKGQRLFYVRNYIGRRDTEPTRMALDPGRYLILLEKPGDRPPVFWVTVEEDRLTEVEVSSLPKAP